MKTNIVCIIGLKLMGMIFNKIFTVLNTRDFPQQNGRIVKNMALHRLKMKNISGIHFRFSQSN